MNVCVFTSTRADFGLLSPLVREMSHRRQFNVRLFVTGTHLDDAHGYTYTEIQKMGWKAFYEVPISMKNLDGTHLSTFSKCIESFTVTLVKNVPDVAVVLGDRFEALAFAIVAHSLGIPLCHLHGGEVSSGALDDEYRHCITKLSFLHFPSSSKSMNRIVRMGENPERVFNVGALAIDNIKSVSLLGAGELSKDLKIDTTFPFIVMTYHPETGTPEADKLQVPAILNVLDKWISKGFKVIATRSNADQGNDWVHEQLNLFAAAHEDGFYYMQSLGMVRYLSLVRLATAVVGNSSSGLYEAAPLGTPTINIGNRQRGRERAGSVIDVWSDTSVNEKEFELALESAAKAKAAGIDVKDSPFGNGSAAKTICDIMGKTFFKPFMKKEFYE
ncbi:UDP-N-acetylglucosamine 2-epimerase [Bdellovibrio sp. HCB-110]|uniref:UDP-N-acetylglucosamine 2-epimerase n=1 Tax=Bdellovibrio sp. HCB-110 TaxID=3391182 RepID=UPI0039B5B03A